MTGCELGRDISRGYSRPCISSLHSVHCVCVRARETQLRETECIAVNAAWSKFLVSIVTIQTPMEEMSYLEELEIKQKAFREWQT